MRGSTQGGFEVTGGTMVDRGGFGREYRTRQVPNEAEIGRVRESVGYRNVQIEPSAGAIRKKHGGTKIDLSANAKGYGVDRVAMVLFSIFCVVVIAEVIVTQVRKRVI